MFFGARCFFLFLIFVSKFLSFHVSRMNPCHGWKGPNSMFLSKLPAHKLTRYNGINNVKLVYSILNWRQFRVFQYGRRLLNKFYQYLYCITLDNSGFLQRFNKEIAKIQFTMLIIDGADLGRHVERNINNLLPFVRQFNLNERS